MRQIWLCLAEKSLKPHDKISKPRISRPWNKTIDGRNPANQLRLVAYPIIYRVLYIPNGAGFLPSTGSSENYLYSQKPQGLQFSGSQLPAGKSATYPLIAKANCYLYMSMQVIDIIWWYVSKNNMCTTNKASHLQTLMLYQKQSQTLTIQDQWPPEPTNDILSPPYPLSQHIIPTAVRSKGKERLDIAVVTTPGHLKAQHCDTSWSASSEISIKSMKHNILRSHVSLVPRDRCLKWQTINLNHWPMYTVKGYCWKSPTLFSSTEHGWLLLIVGLLMLRHTDIEYV